MYGAASAYRAAADLPGPGEFVFYQGPWVSGQRATFLGQQIGAQFIASPADDSLAVGKGIDELLESMQLKAEKLGANAYTSFAMDVDPDAEVDGVQGVRIQAHGCATKLEPLGPWS